MKFQKVLMSFYLGRLKKRSGTGWEAEILSSSSRIRSLFKTSQKRIYEHFRNLYKKLGKNVVTAKGSEKSGTHGFGRKFVADICRTGERSIR